VEQATTGAAGRAHGAAVGATSADAREAAVGGAGRAAKWEMNELTGYCGPRDR
jgi:hypothetical protein